MEDACLPLPSLDEVGQQVPNNWSLHLAVDVVPRLPGTCRVSPLQHTLSPGVEPKQRALHPISGACSMCRGILVSWTSPEVSSSQLGCTAREAAGIDVCLLCFTDTLPFALGQVKVTMHNGPGPPPPYIHASFPLKLLKEERQDLASKQIAHSSSGAWN